MRLTSVFVGVLVAAGVLLVGCFNTSPVSSGGDFSGKGQVQISIKIGKVGSLAKSAAIELDSLVVEFSAPGEAPTKRKFAISGNEQQSVNFEIELAAGKTWTILGRTYAQRSWHGWGEAVEVHYGATQINVVEGVNPGVQLFVNSRYSMLMVRINPVPDSSTYMGLAMGNDRNMMWWTLDDTTYEKGAKSAADTVKLYYDWLDVRDWSTDIQVIIRGDWNGVPNIDLYWGTVNIPQVLAGQDASYSFNLNWIGPSSTTGTTTIEAIIGKVGLITVDGTPLN